MFYVYVLHSKRDLSEPRSVKKRNPINDTSQMTKTNIRFKAKLLRPAESEKAGSWAFLILPKDASAKLPSRGMTPIEGTINGFPFQADARATTARKATGSNWTGS